MLHNFGPTWVRIASQKGRFFGKVDQHCFGLTIISHHAMSFQKNPHRADHENKVVQFIPELPIVQKENFFGKLSNMTNVGLLHNIILDGF